MISLWSPNPVDIEIKIIVIPRAIAVIAIFIIRVETLFSLKSALLILLEIKSSKLKWRNF